MHVFAALLSLAAISTAVPVTAPVAFHNEGAFSAPTLNLGHGSSRHTLHSFNATAPSSHCFNGTHLLNSTGHYNHSHFNATAPYNHTHFNATAPYNHPHFNATAGHNGTHGHRFPSCSPSFFNSTGTNYTTYQPSGSHEGHSSTQYGGHEHANVARAEHAHEAPSHEQGRPQGSPFGDHGPGPFNGTFPSFNGTHLNGTHFNGTQFNGTHFNHTEPTHGEGSHGSNHGGDAHE